MKSTRTSKMFTMQLLSAVLICIAVPTVRAQTTWYVDDDAPGDLCPADPSCGDPLEDGSAAHPFDTIQEGIDAAVNGDTVLVLDGTYNGDGNRDMDFGGRLITVQSQNGADNCVIDCEGTELDPHRAFDFHSGETAAAVLEGLTIRNGYMPLWGGAIRCAAASAPTIRASVFRGNSAAGSSVENTGRGGAIYCTDNAGATLLECTFVGNTAVGGSATLTGHGGALACFNSGDVVARKCDFRDNTAIANARESGDGGAIYFGVRGHLESHQLRIHRQQGGRRCAQGQRSWRCVFKHFRRIDVDSLHVRREPRGGRRLQQRNGRCMVPR